MPTPRHVAYQVRGLAPGGEIWSNTIRFSDDSSGDFTGLDLQAATELVKTRWDTMLKATAGFATGYQTVQVNGYVYNDAGVLVEQAVSSATPLATPGTPTMRLPHQCTVVASLMTGVPGRSRRGRVYLPLTGLTLTNEGRVGSTAMTTIPLEVADALSDLRTAGYDGAAAGLDPVVVSTTGGFTTPITSVRVGNVVDTQRRRTNALAEVYTSAPVL